MKEDADTFTSREIEPLPLTGFKGAEGGWILLVQRLRSKGVRIITKAKVAVILAPGELRTSKMAEKLKDSSISTLVIGDAKEPRRALKAIAEGSEIVQTIEGGESVTGPINL